MECFAATPACVTVVPMDDGLEPGWRERVAQWAAGKERIHELHLFGSRAKGDHVDESDVDLAYVLTGSDPGEVLAYSMFECGDWAAELEALIGAEVHLEFADPATDMVVWPAVREHGQLIYRKPGYLPVV
jgi:predicted nucleotidyltransferase